MHPWHGTVANLWGRHKDFTEFNENFEKSYISWMDYPFLSKFWMFLAKEYSTFNEFIFFSEYSVLLTTHSATSRQYTSGKWLIVQWYEISHKVKDWCSIQRGEAELNRISIFHRMQTLVPLHESIPFAICVVQYLECKQNWIILIRILYLGWLKFHFFFLPPG